MSSVPRDQPEPDRCHAGEGELLIPHGPRGPHLDANRAFARQLAADSIASGDAVGWFETLYAAAEQGAATVPWADLAPNPRLVRALCDVSSGGRAVVIGCGLGDDAEHVASLGFTTVAFDVSPTAIVGARRRFPRSTVEYVTADLLSPPHFLGRRVRPGSRGVHLAGAHRRGAAHGLRADRPAGRTRLPAASHRRSTRRARRPRRNALAAHPGRGRVFRPVRAKRTVHCGLPR